LYILTFSSCFLDRGCGGKFNFGVRGEELGVRNEELGVRNEE
jgi:hypothetical protein